MVSMQGFVECATCADKPGTPQLCDSCLKNRSIIYELMTLIERFVDEGSCDYDHNDLCQAHSLDVRPCPHEVAKGICERESMPPWAEPDHQAWGSFKARQKRKRKHWKVYKAGWIAGQNSIEEDLGNH